MAGTVLFSLAYFFLVMLQCIPGELSDSYAPNRPDLSQCLSFGTITQRRASAYHSSQPSVSLMLWVL